MNKKYLLMVDEPVMAVMQQLLPGMQFLEVQGMMMGDIRTHAVMMTPNIMLDKTLTEKLTATKTDVVEIPTACESAISEDIRDG